MMQTTCIVVDFDGTLAYFKGGYDELFAIFSRRGVDPAVVKECYEQTKRKFGFSISAMTAVVTSQTGCHVDAAGVAAEFRNWLELSLIPYPDSAGMLTQWQNQGIPVVILTAGNSEYQAQKVQATHMPHDQLIVVSHECEKPDVVRQLLEHYGSPVLYIEDRPSVLDAIRECGLTEGEVMTVRLLRRESPYFHEHSAYWHHSCNALKKVCP